MEPVIPAPRINQLQGQRLGPYEVIDEIGRGGMAVVYRAVQPSLDRHVAIKALPPYFLHDESFLARFEQEAKTVARLEHPHILPIYEYSQAGNIPYIVMPLVTGGTLRDRLTDGAKLDDTLHILTKVLDALQYAHARGV